MNKGKIGIIGSQTLGTPLEIYEALYGNGTVLIVGDEPKDCKFIIQSIEMTNVFKPPLTRKERRKLNRRK